MSSNFPPSLVALGHLVDALHLRGELEQQPGLSKSTLHRAFGDQRVKRDTVEEIAAGLGRLLLGPEVARALGAPERVLEEWPPLAGAAVLSLLDRWDQARAHVASVGPGVVGAEQAVLPFVRLAAIDLGLRWGFLLAARSPQVPGPEIIDALVAGRPFGAVLRAARAEAGITRDTLAERLDRGHDAARSTMDAWLDDGVLPQREHLVALACALRGTSERDDPGVIRLVFALRWACTAQELHALCTSRFGEKRARNLVMGVVLLATDVRGQAVAADHGKDKLRESAWGAVAAGSHGDVGGRALAAAAQRLADPYDQQQLMSAAGDWGDAVAAVIRDLAGRDEAERRFRLRGDSAEAARATAEAITSGLLAMPEVGADPPGKRLIVGLVRSAMPVTALGTQAAAAQALGDDRRALELYRELVRVQPDEFINHFWFGVLLGRAERVEDAVRHLMIAQQLQPNDPLPSVEVAGVLLDARRYEEALRVLDEVPGRFTLMDQKLQAHVEFLKGWAFSELRRFEEAVGALTHAIRLNPEHADAYDRAGICEVERGNLPAAREYAKQAAHRGNPTLLEELEALEKKS